IAQNKLLLCRSIPAIHFTVIRFPFGSLFFFSRTTTFYRKETFLATSALNVIKPGGGRGVKPCFCTICLIHAFLSCLPSKFFEFPLSLAQDQSCRKKTPLPRAK